MDSINAISMSERLLINYDYASFYVIGASSDNYISDDSNYMPDNYIELYFSFPFSSYTLKYSEFDSLYSGNIIFEVVIDSIDGGRQILKERWENPYSFNHNRISSLPSDFYGLRRFFLYSGKYKGLLRVLDLNGNREYIDTFRIVVGDVFRDKLCLSSIQIANNIIASSGATGSEAELFYKNQYYVYPNPQREISSDVLTLHIYTEIYNAVRVKLDSIEIRYEIRNAKDEVELEYIRYRRSFSDAIVETISYPIDALPSGVYTLNIRVVGIVIGDGGIIVEVGDTIASEKNFYVINNNITLEERNYYTEDEQFDISEFATMSEDKVNLEFSQFKVIATRNEIILWERLSDLKAKQRFLFKFWYIRNSELGNSFNDKLFEYRERLKYVNTYYSYAGTKNGWNTDRGRIYIKFGEPDYKEDVPGNPTQYPYQIWTYYSIEGGAVFVFVDMMGLENYKLVHSTHSGYLSNSNWQYMINKNYIKNE
jgi:GWxTD domain-containing protein